MATEKLPEIPNDLPPATSSVRDDVNDTFERFMGPAGLLRNEQGIPLERNLLDNEYNIVGALKRIRNIPQWERGLGFKPGLKAEWDSFFALLPKWYSNIRSRLDEKNKLFGADEDASAESREINWMMGRLSKLQTDIDFAAQEALAPPPDPKFAPVQTGDVKKAVEALDQQVQSTRAKLMEIASRGATDPGPRLKGVFSAFKAYVKLWEEAKPGYTAAEQVPTEATKKALDSFARDAETAWSNDNPGKVAPPSAAPSSASSAPPKASEAKSGATAAAPAAGISTTTLWAAAGALGLGALYLASRKR